MHSRKHLLRITLHLRGANGRVYVLNVRAGQSLMRAATANGVEEIAADCGGGLSCATCHVYVDEAWRLRLPPPGADEEAMLEMTAAERRPGSRLSCQIVLSAELDGLSVELPETQY